MNMPEYFQKLNQLTMKKNNILYFFRRMLKVGGLILLFLLLFFSSDSYSTTYYSRATGNWSAAGTWSTVACGNATNSGTTPGAGDVVTICAGHTVYIDASTIACATLNITGVGATLDVGNLQAGWPQQITATTVNIDNGGTIIQSQANRNTNLIFTDVNIGTTTSTANNSSISMTQGSNNNLQITISGTLTLGGGSGTGVGTFNFSPNLSGGTNKLLLTNITVNSNGLMTNNPAASTGLTYTISGNVTNNSTGASQYNNATDLVTLSGVGKTINTSSTITFGGAVTNTGSYQLLCGTNMVVTGTLTNSGGATITGASGTGSSWSRIQNASSVANSGTIGSGSTYIAFSGTITGGVVTGSGTNVKASSAQAAVCNAPTVVTSVASLTGLSYCFGSGPSASQSYTVSGTYLTANVIVTAPATGNYEISSDNVTFVTTTLSFAPTAGTLAATTVYVRLKSGLAAANYNSENVTNASAGATTVNMVASGTVSSVPTVSNAGPNQGSICTSATLAANVAASGTGIWSISSGPNTSLAQFSSTAANNATFTPTVAGSYVLVWTITNAPCSSSSSSVTITDVLPTTSNAGPDQGICSTSTATLAANSPSSGTGAWSISGPSNNLAQLSSSTSPTATFTPAGGAGSYVLTWTISSAPCTASASSLTITVTAPPTTANAGSDQTICTNTATLAGNTATVGSGLWTVVSGSATITTPTSPTSGVTGLGSGTNNLRWTISNSPCTASQSTVNIINNTPTTANAGPNQSGLGTTATLAGNTATVGAGLWTLVSGTATITTPTSPTSGVTGIAAGNNTLRWTITQGACTSFSDVILSTSICPIVTCTFTTSVTGNVPITVAGGQTVCVDNAYTNTITMSGGTVHVNAGVTLDVARVTYTTGTVEVCGTITGTWTLATNRILSNYSNSTLPPIDLGSSAGIFNNYGSPPAYSFPGSTGYTNSNGWTINNKAGGTLTIGNTGNMGATIVNSGTLSFSAGGIALDLTPTARVTNNVGATFNVSAGEIRFESGALFDNKGTTSIYDLYLNSNNGMTMYQSAVTRVTHSFTTANASNFFNFSGAGCAYVNLDGATLPGTINQVLSTATQGKIQYCGPTTTNTYGAAATITTASNTTPIVITTSAAHGFVSGERIIVSGVATNTNANGQWTITLLSSTTFSLNSSTPNGAGTGGTAQQTMLGTMQYLGSTACVNQSPCTTPLPIKLITFNAQPKENKIEINWTSGAEINNDYYTVERSFDGVNFESIATIKGAGNSFNTIDYSVSDNHPLSGTAYYRLKQTDFDGKYEYFEMVAVDYYDNKGDWDIYPNPTNGSQVYIKSLNIKYDSKITINVYDRLGQFIFEKTIKNNPEKPAVVIENTNILSKGIYIVKISTNKQTQCVKLIVE
jgi:hypothetical protein